MLKVHPKSEKSDQKRTKILKKCAIIDKIFWPKFQKFSILHFPKFPLPKFNQKNNSNLTRKNLYPAFFGLCTKYHLNSIGIHYYPAENIFWSPSSHQQPSHKFISIIKKFQIFLSQWAIPIRTNPIIK
jgi:hypothetical protein